MMIYSSILSHVFLISIRLGTVLFFSPIEAFHNLPAHVKIILILMLSTLITLNVNSININTSDTAVFIDGLTEFMNGLFLALSLHALFSIFKIAGYLIDTQIGLNSIAIFNPSSHSHDQLSGRLLGMMAVLYFFALDGHTKLLASIAASLKVASPGHLIFFNSIQPVLQTFSNMFLFGLMTAAPVMMAVLLVEIPVAVLSRNMPQIQIYFLIMPFKLILGWMMLKLLNVAINPLMTHIFYNCLSYLQDGSI